MLLGVVHINMGLMSRPDHLVGILIDLDDERWNSLLQLQNGALRALSDPARRGRRVGATPTLVFDHP